MVYKRSSLQKVPVSGRKQKRASSKTKKEKPTKMRTQERLIEPQQPVQEAQQQQQQRAQAEDVQVPHKVHDQEQQETRETTPEEDKEAEVNPHQLQQQQLQQLQQEQQEQQEQQQRQHQEQVEKQRQHQEQLEKQRQLQHQQEQAHQRRQHEEEQQRQAVPPQQKTATRAQGAVHWKQDVVDKLRLPGKPLSLACWLLHSSLLVVLLLLGRWRCVDVCMECLSVAASCVGIWGVCPLCLCVCVAGPTLSRDQFLHAFVDATSGTTLQLCSSVFEQLKSRGFAGVEDTIAMPTLLQLLQQFHEADVKSFLDTTRKLSADIKGKSFVSSLSLLKQTLSVYCV